MVSIHLTTAILSFLSAILTLYRPSIFKRTIFRLLTLLSLGSGFLLTLSPGHLNRTTCLRLGLYLILIIATELYLSRQLKSPDQDIIGS